MKVIKTNIFLNILVLTVLTVSFSLGLFHNPSYAGVNLITRTDNADEEPVFGGGEVRFLANADPYNQSQQLGSVIRSADGKVIVVDGGVRENAGHLIDAIREAGGFVDAWLITHPHTDHAGALCEILENHPGELDIRGVYLRLFDDGWYNTNDPSEAGCAWKLRQDLGMLPQERVHYDIYKDFEGRLSDQLFFRVLNEPLQTEGRFAGNNAGIVYDVCLNGRRIVFLGDIGEEAGKALLESGAVAGAAQPDFVQLSHHGQRGVSYDFYRQLAPKAAVWSTPEWLFNDSTGKYETDLTKNWMGSLGITANYCTRKGDVILK